MIKKKKVKFSITFDNEGNIIEVETPEGKNIEASVLFDNPIQDVISMAILVLTRDDDPCVVQGGKRWCWK